MVNGEKITKTQTKMQASLLVDSVTKIFADVLCNYCVLKQRFFMIELKEMEKHKIKDKLLDIK